MHSIFDEFKRISGSKIWPSTDPKDSPFDKFECTRCSEAFTLQMYGTSFIGSPSFSELAENILRNHLIGHCSFEFLNSIQTSSKEIITHLILREIIKQDEKRNKV